MKGRGRARPVYNKPLRKPGEVSSEQEEKPAVLTQDKGNFENSGLNDDETGLSNYVQSLMLNDKKDEKSKETALVDVVNAKEFVPASSNAIKNIPSLNVQGNIPHSNVKEIDSAVKLKEFVPSPNAKEFVPQSSRSSELLSKAVFAKEFVPGKFSAKQMNTSPENKEKIRNFVQTKFHQVEQDPGCTEEISSCMLNYLSLSIKCEDDIALVADLLLEKCLMDVNFQYCGVKIATFLDKMLSIPGLNKNFRRFFLNRCKEESKNVKDLIEQNDNKAQNYAMFFGELLMTYKMQDDKPIDKFLTAVVDILNLLLASKNAKFHIIAGKLLKLTGSNLGEHQNSLLTKISTMVTDPSIDRTAQLIFSNLLKSRDSNQRQNDKPVAVMTSPYMANATSSGDMSLYVPSTDLYLEEQSELPVCGEDEWNQFIDESGDSNGVDPEWINLFFEQYGYMPYATADDDPNTNDPYYLDDYDAELDDFTSKR